MKLDKNLTNGSFTIEGYYAFKEVSLSCKKYKLENIDLLLYQIRKVMKRICKGFICTEVFFVRTVPSSKFFYVKFKETITVIG
jgi:hypothetical protein